jgi:hypothetical protein
MYRVVSLSTPCLGKLVAVWALYGFAVAWLWRLAGGHGSLEAAVWVGALAAGIALALREF